MKQLVNRSQYQHPINQLFSEFFDMPSSLRKHPPANIMEQENQYLIELMAPGMDKGDFDIRVEKDHLIISSTMEEEKTDTGAEGKVIRSEFRKESFSRSFHLSDEIDREKIEAKYNNGVLAVTLPKMEETLLPTKKIEIS